MGQEPTVREENVKEKNKAGEQVKIGNILQRTQSLYAANSYRVWSYPHI